MRALDWSQTAVGDPSRWPQSLRTAIRILLTSKFAMWMAWGEDLTFFCNDAYLPTTGIKRDWVLGARSDKVWAEIWRDIGPRIEHVLATGEATWDEALRLYLERSGFIEETYHTFSYSPLSDDEGRTVGMLCVVAEVTDRVIGERQLALLRDMGARLSAASTRNDVHHGLELCLASGAPDVPFALVYLGEAGSNEARLAAVHGFEAGSRLAPPTIDLSDSHALWPLCRARQKAETITVASDGLSALRLKHWQRPPTEALIAPISTSDGAEPVGYFVAGLNPHRAFDTDYRGFIGLLTGQIAAAVARADEFESAKARAEALAEIDRAKTAFFSNISHEFRTPLTLMLGPLESILAKPAERVPPDDRALVEVAQRNAQRLLRLVNALLDFSKIEAERAEVHFQPTKLYALTTELASTFRSACERAGLTLTIEGEELDRPVDVDRDMWEKIVLNLMSNAFKFTFRGGITVKLSESDGRAILEVQDSGVGIPASELPHLFERFRRVQGVQGRSFEGSGIGLALVHDLVKLHGGGVSAISEVGVGTTLRIEIPVGQERLAEDRVDSATASPRSERALSFVQEASQWLPGEPPAETARPNKEHAPGLSRMKREGNILVADDNPDLRGYVRRLLSAEGYEVDIVADGAAALDAIRARRPDLLLSDVMMPKLDGFQLLRAVRGDPQFADLPVIMLSARAGEEAQVEGLEAGADDYLAKPFSARELLARVSANLEMARVRRNAAEQIRTSEAKLQVEREFLASVLAKAPIGISIVDHEGRMSMLNERGVDLLGHRHEARSASDFVGYGAVHADGRPYAPEEYPTLRAARGERVEGERMLYVRGGPSGHERLVLEVDAVPIRNSDGGPAGAVTVFDDAGARERAEDALRARVDRAIADREAALEELHQLQKLETIGQLTGGVAHDFNNLLTPIVAALDILGRRYAVDPRAEKIISGAQQSAERARVLVSRLLTFGRRQHLNAQPVNLGELLSGMSDLIARSLTPQIAVRFLMDSNLPGVIVDPNQLELAILNLCVNSRDAMPEGGELAISVHVVDESDAHPLKPGRYVRVRVADTGAGMARATLERAIEPFFTTKELGRGTGLGLSMVHGLAAQSGGLFHLDSELGRGTTASIYLPAMEIDVEPRSEARLEAIPESEPLRILLVDDEELVRVGTAEMLAEVGHEVHQAASGPGALQILRSQGKFDILIADYMMPGLTGVALISEAQGIQCDLPALLITGYAGLTADPDDGLIRLSKPFGQAELGAAIHRVIASAREMGKGD